jgi:hypothetical protein
VADVSRLLDRLHEEVGLLLNGLPLAELSTGTVKPESPRAVELLGKPATSRDGVVTSWCPTRWAARFRRWSNQTVVVAVTLVGDQPRLLEGPL